MKKILAILCSCAIVLVIGTSVAYYNTKSFGFDENAKIFTSDKDKITFLDFEIYYKDINNIYENIKEHAEFNISI